jgi:DNA-binding NarL/FixJ family response regulator
MKSLLKNKSVLLVSSHTSYRAGLRKTLADLGADNSLIEMAPNLAAAKDRLTRAPVNILITDAEFDEVSGLELLAPHIENNPSIKDRVFILVVDENSPFLEAEFMLKGGDLILKKPFNNDTFITNIKRLLTDKTQINEELASLSSVEHALESKHIDEAIDILKGFKDSSSFAALYAQGKISEASEKGLEAYGFLVKANDKKADLKTLVSLIKIGVECSKHFEMLKFVEAWLQKFPVHRYSLPDITRVILANQKFELLDEFFEMYESFNINEESVNATLAAGYVVAGQHYFEQDQKVDALRSVLKAIHLFSHRPLILLKAMDLLVKLDARAEAVEAYESFRFEKKTDEDSVTDLAMKELIRPKDEVLKESLKMLSGGVTSQELFRVAIRCTRELGRDPNDLIQEAKRAFPEFTV